MDSCLMTLAPNEKVREICVCESWTHSNIEILPDGSPERSGTEGVSSVGDAFYETAARVGASAHMQSHAGRRIERNRIWRAALPRVCSHVRGRDPRTPVADSTSGRGGSATDS